MFIVYIRAFIIQINNVLLDIILLLDNVFGQLKHTLVHTRAWGGGTQYRLGQSNPLCNGGAEHA